MSIDYCHLLLCSYQDGGMALFFNLLIWLITLIGYLNVKSILHSWRGHTLVMMHYPFLYVARFDLVIFLLKTHMSTFMRCIDLSFSVMALWV